MSKLLGIITTIALLIAFILFRVDQTLSMEFAIGAFIIWVGWTAFHDEEVNHGR